jgi:hypothetical protein
MTWLRVPHTNSVEGSALAGGLPPFHHHTYTPSKIFSVCSELFFFAIDEQQIRKFASDAPKAVENCRSFEALLTVSGNGHH